MSELSVVIEEDRRKRSASPGRDTRKDKHAKRRGRSEPGGMQAGCGCRFIRTGGYWYHVTPCRGHELREWPLSDENMILVASGAAA